MSDREQLPRLNTMYVLWARSPHFMRPQMVAAYSEGLVDAFPEEYQRLVARDKEWFLAFGDDGGLTENDGPWTFFTSTLQTTAPVDEDVEF